MACKPTPSPMTKENFEVIEYIKTQTSCVGTTSDCLPLHIKPYQTLLLDFLKSNAFNPDEYYVQTKIGTWTEDDKIQSDTSTTGLTLNLYHLNYFKIILQDKKDFIKDSIVTYRKGNVGGKNFSVTIDKVKNKISGPHYWK